MRPTVLVTGGAGFIGSHTCKALAASGYVPVAYDNLSNGHQWAIRWGPFEQGDIHDRTRLTDVISRYRPIAVMHFAALIEAGISVREPHKFYDNNVAGFLDLLTVMRERSVRNIVFSSTAAVYGIPERTPIDEGHPRAPINPYGATKLTCERILEDFAQPYGLDFAALRYFNAAGADPDGDLGEAHDPETHLIPIVLEAAAGRRPHITIFGDDYPTRDGTCTRDFVHVSDLAAAHVSALNLILVSSGAHYFNLGNGQGHTVREVIDAAATVTGRTIHTETAQRRAGDPPVLIADSTRARKILGWEPHYGNIELQIAHAWKWYRACNSPVRNADPAAEGRFRTPTRI